ncbi:MAG: TatD family hydrolase [Fimbriimonadaceae bacterium]|nr:TatD family hydrolase [Chitinophagales bacterium]
MIDTHTHIYLPEFDVDRNEMLQRAKDVGVEKMFLPNIDKDSIDNMIRLCNEEKNYCYPMMGLHPCSVNVNYENELRIVEEYLYNSNYKFYGVGECGLDYYWDKTFIAEQKIAFEIQIQLAKKNRLPLSIHSRESTDDCIELIAKHKDENLHGVFHCFSGTADQLEKIIALDFYAGIGGVVTFKNGGLDKVIKEEHLRNLVLETDAPYLAPVPLRGKRNEPSYLKYILKRLSEVIGVNEKEIAEITTANAKKIFQV